MRNRYRHRARISPVVFRRLLKLFAEDVTALTASRLLQLNKNSTHDLYGRLRQRIFDLAQVEARPFTGEVEVDESYFGPYRVRGQRGRAAAKKTPVIGLLKRQGRVFTAVIANASKREILPIIRGQVLPSATIYTDGWPSYDGLVVDGYKHYRIHHQKNEFARGRQHINGIESFWAYAKTRMVKLRGIRKTKFLLHLKETEWRWNHRRDNIYRILLQELIKHPLS
jgi:transposase-like protein